MYTRSCKTMINLFYECAYKIQYFSRDFVEFISKQIRVGALTTKAMLPMPQACSKAENWVQILSSTQNNRPQLSSCPD